MPDTNIDWLIDWLVYIIFEANCLTLSSAVSSIRFTENVSMLLAPLYVQSALDHEIFAFCIFNSILPGHGLW